METFSALLAIRAGISPVPGEFPAQRPVTRSFDVFFDLLLNKRLKKQSWGWWFETLLRPLWRHCNDYQAPHYWPFDMEIHLVDISIMSNGPIFYLWLGTVLAIERRCYISASWVLFISAVGDSSNGQIVSIPWNIMWSYVSEQKNWFH